MLSILQSFDIETTEKWREENHIGTYSLRVKLKGCGETGTNGKGVSPQYARASAYAELFERLQNGILIPSWNKEKNSSFRVFPDERILSADDIVEEEDEYKVYTSVPNLQPVTEGLEAEGFKSTSAEFTRVPQNTIEVSDEKTAISIMRLLGKLEEHDDVQNVYANFDIDDDLMAKIEEQL